MKPTILITGTLGFIGSNFIQQVLQQYPEYRWVGIDKAVYDYCLYNTYNHSNYTFYLADITDKHIIDCIFHIEKPSIVINMCAESFVCSSIESVQPFLTSNVIGTQTIIDASVKYNIDRFIQISTDEVYGTHTSINDMPWTENSPIQPRNPYSASKAAAETMLHAAHLTHKLPFNITRCCNVYGSKQPYTRNLLPKVIYNILTNQPIPIYGNGSNLREYLYVSDKVGAIMTILKSGKLNEIYNIGSGVECSNLEIVERVASVLDKTPKIEFGEDRKSHDWRYALDFSKIMKLGWKPQTHFEDGLLKTINWYKNNLSYYG